MLMLLHERFLSCGISERWIYLYSISHERKEILYAVRPISIIWTIIVDDPQAAQRLSISRALLYALLARKQGPPVVRIGRAVRISVASLETWLRQYEQEQQGRSEGRETRETIQGANSSSLRSSAHA
jgi:excisionase family DNA binding protein